MFIKNHQSGEIATILAVSALVILGITTVASSFVFNKNQTTTNTRASGFQGVCSAFSDADMPKPDGFKWQAHCGDEFKCIDPNHSDCQSKFPGKAVWCYGFDGPNKSNADWRCLSLESTAPQAQPTSPMEQSKPINNPAANPQQPAQPNQPAAQQPLPQPANCLSTEGLPNGAQPNCTPGKTVAKDNYYWKIISCKDTNCQPSAGNEWCYGFVDGIGKMQLASPQPIPDACKQSIRLMEAAQSASQPQPNNSGSQPAAQPQAPLEETSRTNPQQPTQPTQANPQTSANSGTTKTDCQNKGFVCLSAETKNAEYPDYEAKQYSCNNTAGINCYGPKAQASAKPLCEQKGGFCSNVCEGDYINSSDPPMNSSCQQSGRNQCCVKKAATPATSCESQGFYSDEPSCKNSKEFKANTGTCQFSAPNGCYKFVKSTQQQGPPVADNTNQVSDKPFTAKIKVGTFPTNMTLFNKISDNGNRIVAKVTGCGRSFGEKTLNTATKDFSFDVFPKGEMDFIFKCGDNRQATFNVALYFQPINAEQIIFDEVKGAFIIQRSDVKIGGSKEYSYPHTVDINGYNKHFSYSISNNTAQTIVIKDITVSGNDNQIAKGSYTLSKSYKMKTKTSINDSIDLYGYVDQPGKSSFFIQVTYVKCKDENCTTTIQSSKKISVKGYNFSMSIQ